MGTSSLGRPEDAVTAGRPAIHRASATDRAFLAMDVGEVPEQFGVVLELDGQLALHDLRQLVAGRLVGVPRLRQRLVTVPWGCGGPIWVDDAGFDPRRHVREVACDPPGRTRQLMDTALAAVMAPLPRDAPAWSVLLVGGLRAGRSAVVVVLHHDLSDGVGGLDVLAHLVDPGPGGPGPPFPSPRPGTAALLRDAMVHRARAVTGVAHSWRLLRTSMGAGGGLRPPRVGESSLLQPTGPRRRAVVVRVAHGPLRAAAHRCGATTNDAVLVAVAAALGRLLERRGEHVDTVVMTVPVSGRRTDQGPDLGNLVSPLLVPVPTRGALGQRLAGVAATVRDGKEAATGPPPIAVLGWLFRPLARLGGYRWYMTHQHRFHTLVSHVRGPAEPLSLGGRRIVGAAPLGVAEGGNTPTSFQVLTYAGTLTITAIVDPERVPEADALATFLRDELEAVAGAGADAGQRG